MPQVVEIEGVGSVEFPDEFSSEKIKGLLDRDFGPKAKAANSIVPAVRKVGGDVAVGEQGDTHPDIIEEHGLTTDNIDQRGFVNPQGQFIDRRTAAATTGLPTNREPGNLHSTDLPGFERPAPLPQAMTGREPVAGMAPVNKLTSPLAEPTDLSDLTGQVERLGQKLGTPESLLPMPTIPPLEQTRGQVPIERMMTYATANVFGQQTADMQAQVQRSLANGVLGLVRFAGTDEGILSGLASLIPAGRLGVEAVFAYDMAKGVLDKAKEMGGDWDNMTHVQKAGAITDEMVQLGMTAMIGKAGMKTAGGQAKAFINRPFERVPITAEKGAALEKLAIDKANESGRGALFTDEPLSKGTGSIAETMDDGSVRFSRPAFNRLVSKQINRGVTPEQAVESVVNQEVIHGGARTLEEGDKLAEDYWNGLSPIEKFANRRRYLGPKPSGEPPSDSDLGHEAMRFQIERASGMTPLEYLAFTRSEALTSKGLTALENVVRSLRGKTKVESQKAMLDKVVANVELAKKGAESASRIRGTEKVAEREVRAPVGEAPPLQQQRKAAPAQAPVAQAAQVPLKPEPPKGPPVPVTQGAPAGAPPPVEAKPGVTAPEAQAISTTTPKGEETQVPGLTPEDAAEYKRLGEVFGERDLTQDEEDQYGAYRMKIQSAMRAKGGVAARMKASEFEDEIKRTDIRPTTNMANSVGLGMNSVQDLKEYEELSGRLKKAAEEARNKGDWDEAMSKGYQNQLVREAIETATNSGSHSDASQSGKALGTRPLDWKTHPEVKEWLGKNASKLGIVEDLRKGVAAVSKEVEKKDNQSQHLLTNAIRAGDNIYISFDITGKVPTARELSDKFKELGHKVDFIQFAPNVFSTGKGEVKFRGDVRDADGRSSSDAAKNAFRDAFGQDDRINVQTRTEQAIPLEERFRKTVRAYADREHGGVAAVSKEGEDKKEADITAMSVSQESKQETEAIPDYAMTSYERLSPEEQEAHLKMLVPDGTPEEEANRIYQQFIDSQEQERDTLVKLHAADLAQAPEEEGLSPEELRDLLQAKAEVQTAFATDPVTKQVAEQGLARRLGSLRRYLDAFQFGTKKLTREPKPKVEKGEINYDINPQERVPSLKGFVKGMEKQGIKVDPASIQWTYLEQLWNHLLNATGERLSEWRKGLKMEKWYGHGGDESMPGAKRIPDAVGWSLDEETGEYRYNLTPEDQDYLIKNFSQEALSKKFGRSVGDKERADRFSKARDQIFRDNEKNQQFRRTLIVRMYERAKEEVLPPEFDPNRKEVTADEVDWEDNREDLGRGQIGHYETFDDAAASNDAYLQSVLDDDARVSSAKSITFTKRVTVVRNAATGDWSILSTYRMPNKKGIPGEIMIMDPETEPGQGKHIRLSELLARKYLRVKASMLLQDPVQNFHMLFKDDPKGIRAEDAYMEAFGRTGQSSEVVSNDLWEKLMQQSMGSKKAPKGAEPELGEEQIEAPPEGTELTEDLPGTGVTKGEGGSFTGDLAFMARFRQRLGDKMRFIIRGPLTKFEAEALADTLNEHDVKVSSDVETMLQVINRRRKEKTLLGRTRGFTPREYIALNGMVKMAEARFVEMRRKPEVKKQFREKVLSQFSREAIESQSEEYVKAVKKFNEDLRSRALQSIRLDIYEIAENNRAFSIGKGINIYAQTPEGVRPALKINPTGFTAEALEKFGDSTGRAIAKSKVQPAAAPEVGKELTMRNRVPPTVTRVGFPPGIPRRRSLVPTARFEGGAPPEMLPPGTLSEPKHVPDPHGAFPIIPTTPSDIGGKRFTGEPPKGEPEPMPFEKGATGKRFQPSPPQPEQQVLRPIIKGKMSRYQPNLLKEAVDLQKPNPEKGVAAMAKEAEGEDRNLFGISQAARENRRQRGEEDLDTGTGDGVIGEKAIDVAKAKYANNPALAIDAISDFKNNNQISEDGVAMSWVHSWKMATNADKLLNTKGYEAARLRAVKADSMAKQMMNEWHRIGKVSQVVEDVNTGSYTAMDVKLSAARKGRGFDSSEKVKAEKIAKETKEGKTELEKIVNKVYEEAGVTKVDPKAEVIWKSFSDDLNKRAAEAEARIKARRAQPPPPRAPGAKAKPKGPPIAQQEMDDYVLYGARKMAQGVQMRKRWSIEMVSELGEGVRPHLDAIWDSGVKMIKRELEERAPKPLVAEVKKAAVQSSAVPTREEVREEYLKVKGKKYGPNLARMLWTQAKEMYLDKGETDLMGKIIPGLATHNGLSALDVIRGIAATKSLRVVTDEMWVKASNNRRAIAEARNWLKNLEYPGWQRFARKIPRIFFINKIFGHGTVGLITHAGNMAFDPRAWKVYFPAWLDMYNFVFSPAKHSQWVAGFVHENGYARALRAGLAINPLKYADDYQIQAWHKLFSWGIGNRGFDALKSLRLARFNQLWDALPPDLKTQAMAREIAISVNHATGITMGRAPEWTNWVAFAPKLEGSRWAWMIGDTARAMRTFKEWKHATPEQRMAAISEVKSKAVVVGFYASLLAMNQGILSAMKSDQQVNFTDPRRGDFWAFKIAGFNVGIVSPMIGIVRLFANLAHAAYGDRNKVEALETRSGEAFKMAGEYLGGKLAPVTQFARNVAFQSDYRGRPMPWSEDKVPAALRRQGIDRYDWGEWITDQFAPIPVEEAAREIWEANAMDKVHMRDIWRSLLTAGFMMSTGGRMWEDMSLR